MDRDRLIQTLKRYEGVRHKPYNDATGEPVKGVGNITIGVGRNLEDRGLTDYEIDVLLETAIGMAIGVAQLSVENYQWLDDARQEVLVNMAFNLGRPRFKTFKKMIAAVEADGFDAAADEMLDSLWAKQVGDRAVELADAMRKGDVGMIRTLQSQLREIRKANTVALVQLGNVREVIQAQKNTNVLNRHRLDYADAQLVAAMSEILKGVSIDDIPAEKETRRPVGAKSESETSATD